MTANPLSTIPPIGPTTGMPMPQQGGKFKPIDPVQLLRQHVWKLAILAVVGGIAGGVLCKVLQKVSPNYTSTAKFVVQMSRGNADDPGLVSTGIGGDDLDYLVREKIARITSEEMINRALQDATAQNTEWFRGYDRDVLTAAEDLAKKHLAVSPARGSALINLSVTMPRPEDAQNVLRAITDQYLAQQRIELQNRAYGATKVYLDDIARSQNELDAKTREMKRFLKEQDLASLRGQESDAAIAFNTLLREQLELEQQLSAARSSVSTMKQLDGEDPDRPMSETEEASLRQLPDIFSREQAIRQLEEDLVSAEGLGLAENHPQIRRIKEGLSAKKDALELVYQQELPKFRRMQLATSEQFVEGMNAQLAELGEKVLEARAGLSDITQKLTTYDLLEGEKDRLQNIIEKNQETVREIRVLQQREDTQEVRVAELPTIAELTSPLMKFWVPVGMFLTTGTLAGFLFVRELLDQRVKSPSDVKLLPDVPLLGLIPHTDEDPSGNRQAECVVEEDPTGLMSEAYRQVRTSVLSKMERRGYKTLLLTSAQPNAGTSSVVQNLAASLAHNNKRVLIVDTNFRRPRQHALAHCGNDRGLVDILRGEVDVDDLLVSHEELSLDIMPTGLAAESPPELLEGAAFRTFLGDMEARYDFVIIDTAPALLTSDSQLMAKHVDAIAVVVQAGSDKRGMVARMLARLDGQRADVLGVILNGVTTSAGGYFRKSYEAFYNYRGEGDRPVLRSASSDRPLRLNRGDSVDREVEPSPGRDLDAELIAPDADGNGSAGNGKH